MKTAAAYHPGPVAPSTADDEASLIVGRISPGALLAPTTKIGQVCHSIMDVVFFSAGGRVNKPFRGGAGGVGGGRGRGRGVRGGGRGEVRGGGRGGRGAKRGAKQPAPTREDLDNDLDAYLKAR